MPRRYIPHNHMQQFCDALIMYVKSRDASDMDGVAFWGPQLSKAQTQIDYYHIPQHVLDFYIEQAEKDCDDDDEIEVIFTPEEEEEDQCLVVDLNQYAQKMQENGFEISEVGQEGNWIHYEIVATTEAGRDAGIKHFKEQWMVYDASVLLTTNNTARVRRFYRQ